VEHSTRYIVLFAGAVCAVCSVVVATAAVSLKDLQQRNATLDVQRKVLDLAGIEEASLSSDEVEQTYHERIEPRIIDLATGEYAEVDPTGWNQRAVMADPDRTHPVEENPARVRRAPNYSVVYHVKDDAGGTDAVILPIQGQGLWGTLYGYFAVAPDGQTVKGITFYEHKETPGLGAEVENPRWKALWPGRKIYGPEGRVALRVIKGQAGPPAKDPYHVDGLSGATITSRGVTNTLAFWLGDKGFGPYMDKLQARTGGN
jgi:Na+-transporting NADH:ubiquinone oxidoreductase subunit C